MMKTQKTIILFLLLMVCIGSMAQLHTKKMPVDAPQGTTAYYEQNIRAFFRTSNWHDGKLLLDTAIVKYPQMSAFNELMGRYYIHSAELTSKSGGKTKPHYDKARYYLIKAINIDEKNIRARYHMLQVETETKHYSSAVVYCNDLLEENPYNEDLWRRKIDLYRKMNNNEEADRLLERLMTIYPGDEQLKKDAAYRMELKALQQKKDGDRIGQEESLRQLIKLKPYDKENYLALTNILYSSGRMQEAADMAGQGASMCGSSIDLIEKKVGILCEMNRYSEALEYVKGCQRLNKSPRLRSLQQMLQQDAARAALLNDPYIAYAKVYDSQHTQEALDFLTNTSIQRGYLDDALFYIREQQKRKGEIPALLFKEYTVQRRLGNKQRANGLLERLHVLTPHDEDVENDLAELRLGQAAEMMAAEQYNEAIPLLEFVLGTNADKDILRSASLRLYNCYFYTRQYAKAESAIDAYNNIQQLPSYVMQKATLYNAWGRQVDALDLLARAYRECGDNEEDKKQQISSTYEEIAVPYIKRLISAGMLFVADTQLKTALEVCPTSTDILHQCISVAQMHDDNETVMTCVLRGKRLFPDDPYYVIKEAQVQASYGEYRESLNTLRPLLDVYVADSTIVGAYAESSELLALQCLKQKHPYEAMAVVDSALVYSPMNRSLLYTKGLVFEQLKEYDKAYTYFKMYKPDYSELSAYNRHMEEVLNHTLKNTLSFEYQQARLGTEDIITGNAYLSYTRKYARNEYTFGLAYAGRDGTGDKNATDMTRGGTGVQASVAWQHRFTERLTAQAMLAGATRFFPRITARLSASYELPKEWVLSLQASYRNVESYTGIYDWVSEVIGYDKVTGHALYGDPEYARVGWKRSYKSLFLLGGGLSKTLGQFTLTGGVDGFLLGKNIYVNGNGKVQFFPLDGNRSHFFAVGGVGNAPESSLIDRSLPAGFNDLNTFVGMGGQYVLNRWMTFALTGTWYTMLNQAEMLATTEVENIPGIRKDYKNYFYIHANVLISF